MEFFFKSYYLEHKRFLKQFQTALKAFSFTLTKEIQLGLSSTEGLNLDVPVCDNI